MLSLEQALKQTMLGTAKATSSLWEVGQLPTGPAEAGPDGDYETNPIWRFQAPAFGGPGVQVQNITCKVRKMGYMEMPVLDSIEWGPVKVSSKLLGDVELPLTPAYLVKPIMYVKSGSINESGSGLWQMPTNIDRSFEMVFGYEYPLGRNLSDLRPLPAEAILSENLFPDGCAVSPADPGAEKLNTLRLPSIRIVVVITLVTCKERFNFEPGGVLGAGRLYPLVMAISNVPLDLVTASVKLTRPTSNMSKMDDEEMAPDSIGAYFFTDRNEDPGLPLPYWDNFFDYYMLAPPPGEYRMVRRLKAGEKSRLIQNAVKNSSVLKLEHGMEQLQTTMRSVRKLPGQGEFDNMHISPKMRISSTKEEVTMAPFCVHDCFHMHWRWAEWNDVIQARGWDGTQPFAKAGAPLVPGNQEVSIQLHSKVSFTYTAKAYAALAGDWQVFLHHGGAYALYVGAKGTGAKDAALFLGGRGIDFDMSWASMYWTLRYGRGMAISPFERISWADAELNILRETAASAAAGSGG